MSWWQKLFGRQDGPQRELPDKDVEAKLCNIRRPAKSGDSYVDSCFDLDFQEHPESRRWDQMQDFQSIWNLLGARDLKGAYRQAEALVARYPDFDVAYSALARVLTEMGRCAESTLTMKRGLGKSRRKALLCDGLGVDSFTRSDLPEAVTWWIKSCALQIGGGRAEHAFPFVNLAYIADEMGLQTESKRLLQQADAIDRRQIRFDDDGIKHRSALVTAKGSLSIRQAISLFCHTYLPPNTRDASSGRAWERMFVELEGRKPTQEEAKAADTVCRRATDLSKKEAEEEIARWRGMGLPVPRIALGTTYFTADGKEKKEYHPYDSHSAAMEKALCRKPTSTEIAIFCDTYEQVFHAATA